MPSQFQLRDLVNHVVTGSVVLFLLVFFTGLYWPPLWSWTACRWALITGKIDNVLLLPLLLAVVYILGAVNPRSRRVRLFGDPSDPRLTRASRFLRRMLGECKDDTSHKGIYGLLREFWLRPDVRTPSQAKEIRLRFAMKAAAQFAIYEKDDFVKDYDKDGAEFERKFEDLLRLASSYVLSEPANVQQADIERHHIMFHFCNKLAVLFSYATIASLVGIGWYFILKHYSLKTTGWGWFMLYEGKNA